MYFKYKYSTIRTRFPAGERNEKLLANIYKTMENIKKKQLNNGIFNDGIIVCLLKKRFGENYQSFSV